MKDRSAFGIQKQAHSFQSEYFQEDSAVLNIWVYLSQPWGDNKR